MQKAFAKLQADLDWFIDQEDDYALVFDCGTTEVAYLLSILKNLDASHSDDLFLLIADPIVDADSYASVIAHRVSAQIDAVNAMRSSKGEAVYALPDASCFDRARLPGTRIASLLHYLTTLLGGHEHRLVVALLPTEMTNAAAYFEVVLQLLPTPQQEWMTHTRLFLRDERSAPFLIPSLQQADVDLVTFYDHLDFSTNRVTESIEAQALDETASSHERMQALIQIAGLDYSYGRLDEAYRKWGVVFDHYFREGNVSMAALALSGAGDVLKRIDRLADAKIKYQQGLALNHTPETLPMALLLLHAVSEVCMRQNEWQEAEGYLLLANELATKLTNISVKCDVLERLGVTYYALGRPAEAAEKLRAAVDRSREFGFHHRAESALSTLILLYQSAGMTREVEALESERQLVRAEMHGGHA